MVGATAPPAAMRSIRGLLAACWLAHAAPASARPAPRADGSRPRAAARRGRPSRRRGRRRCPARPRAAPRRRPRSRPRRGRRGPVRRRRRAAWSTWASSGLDALQLLELRGALLPQDLEGGGLLEDLGRAVGVQEQGDVAEGLVVAHVGLAAEVGHVVLGAVDLGRGRRRARRRWRPPRPRRRRARPGGERGTAGGLRLDGHALEGLLGLGDPGLDGGDLGGGRVVLGLGGATPFPGAAWAVGVASRRPASRPAARVVRVRLFRRGGWTACGSRRCRVAKATRLRSLRPPTELADGFGPEGALRGCVPVRRRDSPQGINGSPVRAAIGRRGSAGPGRCLSGSRAGLVRTAVDGTWGASECHGGITECRSASSGLRPRPPCRTAPRSAGPSDGGPNVWQAVRIGAVAQLVRAWDS